MASLDRRTLLAALGVVLALAACGGTISTLRTQGKPSGSGPAQVTVQNNSGVAVFELYLARTEAVDASVRAGVEPGSSDDAAVWGEDQLDRGRVNPGGTVVLEDIAPDRYDVLAIDPDGRDQLVKGLMLKAGGRYVLELGDRWRFAD